MNTQLNPRWNSSADRQSTPCQGDGECNGTALDPVATYLDQLRLRCQVTGVIDLAGRMELPRGRNQPSFCFLISGSAVLADAGSVVCDLQAGEIAFFRGVEHGNSLMLSASSAAHPSTINMSALFRNPASCTPRLLTGVVNANAIISFMPLGLFPDVLKPNREHGCGRLLEALMEMATHDAATMTGGKPTVMNQLSTVICLEALRQHLASIDADSLGWLRALHDSEIGLILTEMLQRPDKPWTIASLANLAQMARSTFARKFQQLTGEAPMSALLGIRMRLACERLRSAYALKEISRQVGYRSVSAFTSAFHRWSGQTPRAFRLMAAHQSELDAASEPITLER